MGEWGLGETWGLGELPTSLLPYFPTSLPPYLPTSLHPTTDLLTVSIRLRLLESLLDRLK